MDNALYIDNKGLAFNNYILGEKFKRLLYSNGLIFARFDSSGYLCLNDRINGFVD